MFKIRLTPVACLIFAVVNAFQERHSSARVGFAQQPVTPQNTTQGNPQKNLMGMSQQADEDSVALPLVFRLPVTALEGYATDGTLHYVFDTKVITAYDAAWHIVWQNNSPLEGLSAEAQHLGVSHANFLEKGRRVMPTSSSPCRNAISC